MIKQLLRYTAITVLPLLLTGCSLFPGNKNNSTSNATPEQTLTIWRQPYNKKIDDASFEAVIAAYQKANQGVKIVYRSFDASEDYETEVLNALAAGNGPDIWEIRNDELPRHKDKLIPLTGASADNYEYFKKNYAATIAEEMLDEGQLYGMPLGVDPMVVFYNKTHLEEANAKEIPTSWEEFVDLANILTRKVNDQIYRPGLALGTVSNVDRASQILELLMLQFRTQMTDSANRTATFDLYTQSANGQGFNYPGQNAVQLYSYFANPGSGFQTWDANQPYSTQAFAAGNLSMMINYQSIAPQIAAINPKLDFAIALVPQRIERTFPQGDLPGAVSDPVFTARYRALVASKPSLQLTDKQRTAKASLAKGFITLVTSAKTVATFDSQNWLMQAHTPDASRSNITRTNPMHANLKTWHKGPSPKTVDQVMTEMLRAITEQNQPVGQTLTEAAQIITGILQ